MGRTETLLAYYDAMFAGLGPGHWWPAQSPFEVAVGAVLTQNTAWRNVEKAMELLLAANALSPAAMYAMPVEKLETCLRPSGVYRIKTKRMLALLEFFASAAGQPTPLEDPTLSFLQPYQTQDLRRMLLQVKGIGPETADCILLYALQRPVFVVDAYTRRIFSRHGQLPPEVDYHEMQEFFSDALPHEAPLFNEYHALIVRIGKDFCKKSKPLCGECPLGRFLDYAVE